ncbi:MAG TPA: multicopper oxidase domain-containing protein [Candidatus Krumholzibacteria bacterium]|nr:multicopper oxidase domain-containing protein [Candidatus Krumholzibacteria bacterium]
MSLRVWSGVGLAGLMLVAPLVVRSQVPLDPSTQPKFVNPLPIAARIDMTAGGYLEIEARQVQQQLGVYDPWGVPLTSTVWGYDGTYPGPTIVARSNVPVDVRWTNGLTGPGGPLPHILPVDRTLHWANPAGYPECGVPLVTHIHGGHTESASDGLPDAWFTPGFSQTGHGWVKEVLHYDNTQEAGTVWYHDHALGITRLNVYAGLAGFYLIRDANEDALVAANHLPTGPYEIEMAIQDKMFTTDGALYFPALPEKAGDPDPNHLPEFFGNVILVNAKAWPVLDVEPRQYRFRMLNGSDSRFYELWTVDRDTPGADQIELKSGKAAVPTMYQIGTDDGLLNAPVLIKKFLLSPGERKDMVFDFSNPALWGRTFVLRNNARAPYPMGAPVDPNTTGQVMMFRVNRPLDTSTYPVTTLPDNLRPLSGAVGMPVPNAGTRGLILFEGTDEYGRLQSKLGTLQDGALMWDDPITENPMVNDTEVWEVYNTTADAHPIHLHLVAFRVLDRQKFKATVDPTTGQVSNVQKIGQAKLPGPDEAGWKDTVVMYPGEVTRIVATFDREGLYVWHCHILSHEDHEMMRPYYVGPMASMPSAALAVAERKPVHIESVYPNPFNPQVQIRFDVKAAGRVDAAVYDVAGRLVRRLENRAYPAGSHLLSWDGVADSGAQVSTGVYFLRISANGAMETRRLVLVK